MLSRRAGIRMEFHHMTPLDFLAVSLGLVLGIATVLPSVVLLIHFRRRPL